MSKTAILIFSHVPEIEARIKDFAGLKNTRRISSFLTKHFIQLAQSTTRDTFWHNSLAQEGNSFGERLAHAFESFYAKGYDAVVCIGNDCPELHGKILDHAIQEVENGKTILGPTKDAGAYLIAIPKKAFCKQDFLKVKWQSNYTYEHLKLIFQQEELVELIALQDVNHLSDFYQIKKNKLAKTCLEFICNALENTFYHYTFNKQKSIRNYDFKAPPMSY